MRKSELCHPWWVLLKSIYKEKKHIIAMDSNNTCMHGVIWVPRSTTFSSFPPINSTRGFRASSRRSVSSIVSESNLT